MREIKFRSWDGENIYYRAFGAKINPPVTEFGIDFPASYSPYWATGNMLALMQFTGVKDKNGKEIYEGDVVKGSRSVKGREGRATGEERFIGFVEYDEWWGAFRRKGVKQHQGISAEFMHAKEMEVIGNIYENPELLLR